MVATRPDAKCVSNTGCWMLKVREERANGTQVLSPHLWSAHLPKSSEFLTNVILQITVWRDPHFTMLRLAVCPNESAVDVSIGQNLDQ